MYVRDRRIGRKGSRLKKKSGAALSHASVTLVYMMPQEDKGLAIWQVQADWQYWRTVW